MTNHPDCGNPDEQVKLQLELQKQEAEKRQREWDAKYPEHVKLRAVHGESQKLGAFLDWLMGEKGRAICFLSQGKNYSTYELVMKADESGYATIEDFLGEYFDIDQKKLAAEKDAMLEEQRALNERLAQYRNRNGGAP